MTSARLATRVLDLLDDSGQRPLVAQRAHLRGLVGRVADAEGRHACLELGDELVVHVLVDEDPLGRCAHLPGEVEAAEHRAVDRRVHVGIGEDDRRAVSAELEQLLLQARLAGDLLAGRGRAGEEDAVDIVVGDQGRAGVAVALDQVHDAGREAGLCEQRGEHARN